MYKKIIALWLCLLTITTTYSSEEQQHSIFKNGDNVGLIGDSITHGGYYTQYIMQYFITRYPNMRLYFKNLGISGDTTTGVIGRMDRDILSSDPDVVTVMIGMNDVNRRVNGGKIYNDINKADTTLRREVAQTFEQYTKNLTEINETLRANVREMILLTPSIYDQTSTLDQPSEFGTNDGLNSFRHYIMDEASKYNAHVIDMWEGTNYVNNELQKIDPKASVSRGDRVHPENFGGFVMAAKFIEDLGEKGCVSSLSIDAKSGEVMNCENSEISNVTLNDGAMSFDLLTYSLPFTQDDVIAKANEFVDFQEKMNREIIQVDNLRKGIYCLLIDGVEVGKYTNQEFKAGVNLAQNHLTPQYQQSEKVAAICADIRSQSSDYRTFAHVNHLLQRNGYDQTDRANATVDYIKTTAIKTARNSYVKGCYDFYVENRHDKERLYQELLNTQDRCYEAAQPLPHNYKIVFTQR